MTVSTAPVVVPAPERERVVRQAREAHEVPAAAHVSRAPEPASGPQSVVLAGEDEDACRREPHIWRGID
ncbi:hypothetical protein AB0945_37710 [Streptomyces sp. NPDC005474]|uniref:hypothetical protein n=1 Tax=Streptomyces sp. NPDC005474 TaxID=3154878 RepID=UPI003453CD0B